MGGAGSGRVPGAAEHRAHAQRQRGSEASPDLGRRVSPALVDGSLSTARRRRFRLKTRPFRQIFVGFHGFGA